MMLSSTCPHFVFLVKLSAEDVEATKHVASARVHIERNVSSTKEFHILDKPIPINMLDIANAIFTAYALLCSFRRPLINDEKNGEADTG